jgi:hypothetical protein
VQPQLLHVAGEAHPPPITLDYFKKFNLWSGAVTCYANHIIDR